MYNVFLSYAREDSDSAFMLFNNLSLRNISVWFDKEVILPGQDWEMKIKEGIEQSQFFIPLISKIYIYKQGQVQVEMRYALKKQLTFPPGRSFIIPVRLENVEPLHDELKAKQYLDFFPSFECGFKKLLGVLLDANYKTQAITLSIQNELLTRKIEQGKQCLRQTNFSGAQRHFKEIIDQFPENEEALLLNTISEFSGNSISSQHPDFIDKINKKLLALITSQNESIQRQAMVFLAILRIDYYDAKHRRFIGPDYTEIRKFLLKRLPSKDELAYLSMLNFTDETRRKLNLFNLDNS